MGQKAVGHLVRPVEVKELEPCCCIKDIGEKIERKRALREGFLTLMLFVCTRRDAGFESATGQTN
jgi:hypothetical protein